VTNQQQMGEQSRLSTSPEGTVLKTMVTPTWLDPQGSKHAAVFIVFNMK
jgi:hypothetical protein